MVGHLLVRYIEPVQKSDFFERGLWRGEIGYDLWWKMMYFKAFEQSLAESEAHRMHRGRQFGSKDRILW